MKTNELVSLGIPKGQVMDLVHTGITQWIEANEGPLKKRLIIERIIKLGRSPQDFRDDSFFSAAACGLLALKQAQPRYIHELIHHHIAKNFKAKVLLNVENHHNFAWKEECDGKEVIIHRKGATPAQQDELGIIPGSMGTCGYVVRGKGKPESLNSASHGAGRKMSRKKARESFRWSHVKKYLEAISAIDGSILPARLVKGQSHLCQILVPSIFVWSSVSLRLIFGQSTKSFVVNC
jgi:hypothetical protein